MQPASSGQMGTKTSEAGATTRSNDIIPLLKGGAITALLHRDQNLPFRDLQGNTALIWCADAGQTNAVSLLLESKADVNRTGISGNTALMRASRNGHYECVQSLLRYGANTSLCNDKKQVALGGPKADADAGRMLHCDANDTLLHHAYMWAHDAHRSPGLSRRSITTRLTALHFAAFYQHPRVCQLLCESGAPLDALDLKGRRPYQDTSSDEVRSVIGGFERRATLRSAAKVAVLAAALGAVAYVLATRKGALASPPRR